MKVNKELSMKKTPSKCFIVEHLFTYGWDDAGWTTTKRGKSTTQTFPSRIEAIKEIRDHVKDCKEAVKDGQMEDAPKMNEFRVREIHPE